jgi:DNA-binding transcriptional LysR family regulator
MDRFRELATFLAVAEEGAFNAAARRLRASPPAVTRQVTALEERLGVQLLARTTRQVTLTEAGRRLRDDAARILGALEEAEATAAGVQTVPSGELSLTAPVLFGRRFVAPILRDYLDAYPAVTARALFIDRNVSLQDEGLDVALRIGPLSDSALTALRVGTLRRVVVAAPAYLKRRGTPKTPDDLRGHRLVFPTGVAEVATWTFVKNGRSRTLRLTPALRLDSIEATIDAAVAGWGITRLLSYQVADEIAAGKLVEILAETEDNLIPVHLLHAEGRHATAKLRSFLDFADERLRGDADGLLAR